jgi:hypothetical protein
MKAEMPKAPQAWTKRFDKQPGCNEILARLKKRGRDPDTIRWYLWYDCDPENWRKLQKSYEHNRREIRRLKKGLAVVRLELFNQIKQSLEFFRCGKAALLQIPDVLREFREWFDLNCALNKSKQLNFHWQLLAVFDFCRFGLDSERSECQGWERDVSDLVNAALDAHDWIKGRPRITVDSIRRYTQRKRFYSKRDMERFFPINR